MKARVCQLFEVFQHEFANFRFSAEGRFKLPNSLSHASKNVLICLLHACFLTGFVCSQKHLKKMGLGLKSKKFP